MAVVDIYDALITARPYRKALSQEEAVGILKKESREGKLATRSLWKCSIKLVPVQT